jgi:hypothetical protein
VKITTVEQARALPEVDGSFYDLVKRLDPETHTLVVERVVRPFVPQPTDGDQILLFIDTDGRRMQVVYTKDGPAKTEFRS